MTKDTKKKPIIEPAIVVVAEVKKLKVEGNKRYTVQFFGDSGQWVYAFPLRSEMLLNKKKALEAISKMEEVSLLAEFKDTKYRLVQFV